jgi:hypothetical protein
VRAGSFACTFASLAVYCSSRELCRAVLYPDAASNSSPRSLCALYRSWQKAQWLTLNPGYLCCVQCKTRLETHFKNVDSVVKYYQDCICEVRSAEYRPSAEPA